MRTQAGSTKRKPIESVAVVIKRWLRITDDELLQLMMYGDQDRDHYVGGYTDPTASSEMQEILDRDNEGWEVVD